MEALLFITLVIIIILLMKIQPRQKQIEGRTHQSFLSLKKELAELKEAAKNMPVAELPVKPTDENVVQWRPYTAPEIMPLVNITAPIK